MTQHSEYGAFVNFDAAYCEDGSGVQTSLCRDALINNCNHATDADTFVRLSQVFVAGETIACSAANTWVFAWASAHVVVGLRPDGVSFPLISMLCVGDPASGKTHTWSLRLRALSAPFGGIPDASDLWANEFVVTHTGTTPRWVFGTRKYVQLRDFYLNASKDRPLVGVNRAGTSKGATEIYECNAELWCKTSDASDDPILYGAQLREYMVT